MEEPQEGRREEGTAVGSKRGNATASGEITMGMTPGVTAHTLTTNPLDIPSQFKNTC